MTYTLLIYSSRSEREPLPTATEELVLAQHRTLQEQTIADGEFLASVKLGPPSQGRRIKEDAPENQQLRISDGPYLESKEWLVGFYLLDCPDEESALARARHICPEATHTVEVRPVEWHRMAP